MRRLIDALPRFVASQANPQQPSVAGEACAVRNAIDDRVFGEIKKNYGRNMPRVSLSSECPEITLARQFHTIGIGEIAEDFVATSFNERL